MSTYVTPPLHPFYHHQTASLPTTSMSSKTSQVNFSSFLPSLATPTEAYARPYAGHCVRDNETSSNMTVHRLHPLEHYENAQVDLLSICDVVIARTRRRN